MNKTQIDYARTRINKISMCLSGAVKSEFNTKLPVQPAAHYTLRDILVRIKAGDIKLKALSDKALDAQSSGGSYLHNLYDIPARTEAYNKWVTDCNEIKEVRKTKEDQITMRTRVIYLEADHILDKMVSGAIGLDDLPSVLDEFARKEF